jgi:N-acetylmuramoyl-L-alanine amidase
MNTTLKASPPLARASRWPRLAILAISLAVSISSHAKGHAPSTHDLFEKASALQTSLEAKPESARTLTEFQKVIAAYRSVYLTTPQAPDATASLMDMGGLYEKMGAGFNPKYFDSAIVTYDFLLHSYPQSRYRSAASYQVAVIQLNDLHETSDAEESFKAFLNDFPDSPQASAAQAALDLIAREREEQADLRRTPVHTQDSRSAPTALSAAAHVTSIRTFATGNYTRVVVELDQSVTYQAAEIRNPDRVFFDISTAHLPAEMLGKIIPVSGGSITSIRAGQYQKSVVRLVLDLSAPHNYSAFLLQKPHRLVIDVQAEGTPSANLYLPRQGSETPSDSLTPDIAPFGKNSVVNDTADDADPPLRLPARTAAVPGAHKVGAGVIAEPPPTHDGQRSLTRALGLKINRIVIDAGHGGHDTGTIGRNGLMEKDLCLDVALRLGRLIKQRLPGSDVVYTRKDDTFIPLEQRTAIANEAKADLFISIHANSSPDPAARGIETYYLNFATSDDALEVAARENATSQTSVHDLQDVIKKIARNDKIEESKELAEDVQDSLSQRMLLVSHSEKSRGVKRAPFVVLIGANMPSILAEISFVSNPSDEHLLHATAQRQRIAEGLYSGVETYLGSLNSISVNRVKTVAARRMTPLPSPDGNPE